MGFGDSGTDEIAWLVLSGDLLIASRLGDDARRENKLNHHLFSLTVYLFQQ